MPETKDLILGLLNYVEEIARMTERAVFSIRSYRMLSFLEHELQNHIGIQHDVMDSDGTIWLRIERLLRTEPPVPSHEVAKWVTVSRDPHRLPVVVEQLLETMAHVDAQRLVDAEQVD